MNYLPFVGWFFYAGGAASSAERASFSCSWGLLEVAPASTAPAVYWVSILCNTFSSILGG
jgi:hypothetical protein